jgi:MFS family permease
MLLAYDRTHSAWVVSAVLAADLVASMLFGPVAGAAADRWPRRRVLIAGDLLGAAAFAGIALVPGTIPLIAFAALAGAGVTLAIPAQLAYLPELCENPAELEAANGAYAGITQIGLTGGMALAGALLIPTSATFLVAVNAATFALSAAFVWRIRRPERRPLTRGHAESRLMREAVEGMRECMRSKELRPVLLAGAAANCFLALMNVGEVLLARDVLHGSGSAYSLMVGAFGVGVLIGSLTTLGLKEPKARFRLGLLVAAAGLLGSALAPSVAVALATFAVCGLSSGLLLVAGRAIVHQAAPEQLRGRAFGVRDQLGAWAFAMAFIAAPLLVQAVGTRGLFFTAGAGVLVVVASLNPIPRGVRHALRPHPG